MLMNGRRTDMDMQACAGVGAPTSANWTYEELCRAHIDRMLAAAAAAAARTDLSDRVGGWRARIGPILEEESRRTEFDIHDYGQRVLDRLEQLSLHEHGALKCTVSPCLWRSR